METSKRRRHKPADFASLVGVEVGRSEWLTVTQEAIEQFAEVTGDRQWIHTDPHRARGESPYTSTVAHGFFTLSLFSRLFHSAVQIEDARFIVNYGLNRVRFPAPVLSGSRIRAWFAVQSYQAMETGCDVTFEVRVEADGVSKPCCIAEWVLRFYV